MVEGSLNLDLEKLKKYTSALGNYTCIEWEAQKPQMLSAV